MARKNWSLNPGFEAGSGAADAWLATGVSLTGITGTAKTNHDTAYVGTYSQKIEYTFVAGDTGTTMYIHLPEGAAASAAQSDNISISIRVKGTIPSGLRIRPSVFAHTAAHGTLDNLAGSYVTSLTDFQELKVNNFIPAGATTDHVDPEVQVRTVSGAALNTFAGTTITLWVDCLLTEKVTAAGTWFDGSHGGAWDGSANASTSQQVASAITDMSPSSGAVGTSVTLTGTNFGTQTGAVKFATTAATVTAWTETSITCLAPNLSGTKSVTVEPSGVGAGTTSTGTNFTYTSTTVTSVSPASTDLIPGMTIVINGTYLGSSGTVLFGTTPASVLGWNANGTSVTCIVPYVAAGATNLYVIPSDGASSAAYSVTVIPVPVKVKEAAVWASSPLIKAHDTTWKTVTSVKVKANGAWWTVGISPDVPIVPPTGTTITVSTRTQAAFDAAVASAQAGDTVYCPAGAPFTRTSTSSVSIVADYVNVKGDGIYMQAVTGGGGGTWLAFPISWGSGSKIEKLLVGCNTAGETSVFKPQPRGTTSTLNPETHTNGAHDTTFSFVRFKGGSDTGAHLLDTSGNFSSLWTGTMHYYDLWNTTFDDCEFERPQHSYATWLADNTIGSILNIWIDSRLNGGKVFGLKFRRCHFGVMNSRSGRSGSERYGVGRTILFQPSPSEHGVDGPRPASGTHMVGDSNNGWNPTFDWTLVDHGFHDILFQDCLMEYANWYPMDVCDYARSYSVWQGNHTGLPGTLTTALSAAANTATGWGNPPGANWTQIPAVAWNDNFDVTRCYHKGSTGGYNAIFEMGRNCTVTGSGTNFSNHNGSYGNTNDSVAFVQATRPATALFPADWTGTGTSYTASPYDPA